MIHLKNPLDLSMGRLREDEFVALATLIGANTQSAGSLSARLVLVNGMSQADAMRATGASRSGVNNAVKRYLQADAVVRKGYGLPDRESDNANA